MKRINVGISSIVVIFVTISMITFAMLGYLSARQNLNITTKTVESINQYYELSNQAYDYINHLEESDTFTIHGKSQSLNVEVMVEEETKTIVQWQIVNNDTWIADDGLNILRGD